MKIAALISVVAAGRQARDAQSLFEKMLGNNIKQAKSGQADAATDSLYQILQFYLANSGMVYPSLLVLPSNPYNISHIL